MHTDWLLPDLVFDGESLCEHKALRVKDNAIEGVYDASSAPEGARRISGILSPGFIDLQVNGGGGVLFNAAPTPKGISAIIAAHRKFGTTGLLPTVITDASDVMEKAVNAVLAADGLAGMLGIHIEGPHISVSRRGTHAECFVRPMDKSTMLQVERLRNADIAVMITLAPEAATVDQIAYLASLGAVVSIGHSDASSDDTKRAIEAGAKCATHLFNAMSPMLNRAPGVTGAVINSNIAAGMIVDGIHVSDEMIGLAMRARPVKDKMFLVSDAMPTVGGPDKFNLYGVDVHLENGRIVNDEGSLAGAHLTLAKGVHRLANVVGIDRTQTLRAAITVPSNLIGCTERAKIVGMPLNDLICLDADLQFTGFLES